MRSHFVVVCFYHKQCRESWTERRPKGKLLGKCIWMSSELVGMGGGTKIHVHCARIHKTAVHGSVSVAFVLAVEKKYPTKWM